MTDGERWELALKAHKAEHEAMHQHGLGATATITPMSRIVTALDDRSLRAHRIVHFTPGARRAGLAGEGMLPDWALPVGLAVGALALLGLVWSLR